MSISARTMFLFVAMWACASVPGLAETVVELRVVDMFGRNLRGATITELDQAGNVKDSWPIGTSRKTLSQGLHRLRIHVVGFGHETLDINIFGREAFRVVGMKIGSLTGGDPRVSASVRVPNTAGRLNAWIRAVPVFSREITEAKADSAGEFNLGMIEAGRYVLELVIGDRVVCAQQVDVVGEKWAGMLDLRSCKAP